MFVYVMLFLCKIEQSTSEFYIFFLIRHFFENVFVLCLFLLVSECDCLWGMLCCKWKKEYKESWSWIKCCLKVCTKVNISLLNKHLFMLVFTWQVDSQSFYTICPLKLITWPFLYVTPIHNHREIREINMMFHS